jgi:putative tricarboxylic transport membrane protein
MIDNFLLGFNHIFSFSALLYCLIGVILGTLTGLIPGLGTVAVISLFLPFITVINDPTLSIILLAGIYYGAQYGGSTTAILFKIPGESSSLVTTLDGYQMNVKGNAGQAITIAALSSFFAGCISVSIVFLFSKDIADFSMLIGPIEFTWLMFLGLIMSVFISRQGFLSSISMLLLGILLGTIGIDTTSGVSRFTFESLSFSDGINFAFIAMGIFGLSEIFTNIFSKKLDIPISNEKINLGLSKKEVKESVAPTVRGTMIGSILGAIPGTGTIISPFASYYIEKLFSKNKHNLGKGEIAGVAGPEAANNAAAQTSFIPLFSLGVPFTPVMALILSALALNGRNPGPTFISAYPEMFYGFVVSMLIGNIILIILNVPLIKIWISVLKISKKILFPSIITLCFVGVYFINNNIYDCVILILFILIGMLFKYLDCDPIPLAMGFICGKLFEEYFRRAMIISDGNLSVFVFHPIFFVSIISLLVFILYKRILKNEKL